MLELEVSLERQVYWGQVMSCVDFIPSAAGDAGEVKAGNDRMTFGGEKPQSGGSTENALGRGWEEMGTGWPEMKRWDCGWRGRDARLGERGGSQG